MASTEYSFFIITKKLDFCHELKPGCICCRREINYKPGPNRSGSIKKLRVSPVNSRSLDYEVDIGSLKKLNRREAELLLACEPEHDRLKWLKDGAALQTAQGLKVGTAVTVEDDGKTLRGVIRYIGPITHRLLEIAGTYFGIELQGADRGQGQTNGTFQHAVFFKCAKNCGVFAPFCRVTPTVPSLSSQVSGLHGNQQNEMLTPGDRVTYFIDDKCRHGMVVEVFEENGQFVRISTDTDENGKQGGEVKVPLEVVVPGEIRSGPESMDVDPPSVEANPSLHLGVNSMVEVTLATGNAYGIIRWIGNLSDYKDRMVGLELEEDKGVSDGTFKGQRFFSCPNKKALFVKLTSCRPDSRFQSTNHDLKMLAVDETELYESHSTKKMEAVPPLSTQQVSQLLIGQMKGIQGHCNSCYMDAALFSLFSCSSVLDSMLFKSTTPHDAPIQSMLLHDIVNPLRSKGFVEGRNIMRFRKQLQNHGYSHSFTTDEKDPEEFLSVIMHHILALDPLLKLSAAGKVQESYCYQIFLDQNHRLVLPTVQQLLEHSFHSAGLKLAEVPSCFILQMPRFGKKFKMFDKIVPSLELDITDLLSEGPQQCFMCGNQAELECADCFKDPAFSPTGFKVLCESCSARVHSHPQRRSHEPGRLVVPKGYLGQGVPHTLTRDRLELFAVLCIETSHYVSFVKHGPNTDDWIFFDSMADRQGETDGFNIPEVRACPEVGTYLEMPPAELANQVPRDMKGVAKRLFCDAYMFLYQNNNMCLYR